MPKFPQTTPYKATPVAGDRIMGLDSENNNAMTEFPFNTSSAVIDVSTYGAVGDGVTDDTASIQDALDYAETLVGSELNSNRVVVYFPYGIYKTTYTLLYCSNLTIDFNGSFMDFYPTQTEGVFMVNKSYLTSRYALQGEDFNVTIKNGTIRTPASPLKGNGVGICRAKNVTVENMKTMGMKSHLVDISGGREVTVKNCYAKDVLATAPYQIDNLEYGNSTSIWVELSDHSITSPSLASSADNYTSQNVRILNNYAENCYHAIHFHRQNGVGHDSNVIVANNIAVDCTYPIYFDSGKSWKNISIVNNIIYSSASDTIAILANGLITNLIISGNQIHGYDQSLLQNSSGATLTNFVFSNNQCYSTGSVSNGVRALFLKYNISGALINGNYFNTFQRGVEIPSTSVASNITISNNKFDNCTERAIGIFAVDRVTISDNEISNINQSFDMTDGTGTAWTSSMGAENGFDNSNYKLYADAVGKAGITVSACQNWNIIHNIFTNIKSVCIAINDNTWYNGRIVGNICNSATSLVVTDGSVGGDKLYIKDNIVRSTDDYPLFNGVYIEDSTNIDFIGNIIDGTLHNAVDFKGSSRITVTGNHITGGFTTGADHKGISFADASKIRCFNNVVDGSYEKWWQLLTHTDNPIDTETCTIGSTVYTFVNALGGANTILINIDPNVTYANLVAAINGDAGEGTGYGTGTVANTDVTADIVLAEYGGTGYVYIKAIRDRYVSLSVSETLSNASWYSGGVLIQGNEAPFGNGAYYFSDTVDFDGEISKYITWGSTTSASNVRVYFKSNTSPNLAGGAANKNYAVGSIVTNDNNTGGTPNGEPTHWICTAAGTPPTASTWTRSGQIGYRTTAGNPISNNVVPQSNHEMIWDSSSNRWFMAGQDDQTATPTDNDWQQISNKITSGTGSPSGVVTPTAVGEEYLDTAVPRWYKSTGLTNTDWVALN